MTGSARVLDVLALARAVVEAGHCKGHYAVDISGAPTQTYNPAAAAYCASGAVSAALGALGLPLRVLAATDRALQDTCQEQYGCWVEQFNDAPATTQADVLALFDQAAARVGKR